MKKNFQPKAAYLKINNWNNFEVLISIPEKEFTSKGFLKAYDDTQKTEDSLSSESIVISYTFAAFGKSFNEAHVGTDGFFLKNTIQK